ncbi:hypothetical protein Zm00014a_027918 [Zea mays]|uniref:Uncharacterized protein n=1 Tax=Zea mays TaxID=4577 RepID=A0A3L6EXN3_MAIZE|nr:hypothetical protein Zm00014a_027918 [Zea mays]
MSSSLVKTNNATQAVCAAALCIVLVIMSSTAISAIQEIETLCDPVTNGVCDEMGACGRECQAKAAKHKQSVTKITCERNVNPVECCCTFVARVASHV